jgi:AraC family transcriptional regulator
MNARFGDGHFIGGVLGSRQVSGLTLAETVYTAGLHVPAHAHDNALCCLVLEGSFTERLGSRRSSCEPGSLIYHPADEPHGHDFHRGGGRCFNVQFGEDWAQRIDRFGLRTPGSPAELRRGRAAWLTAQLYQEYCTRDSASAIAIEGYALALLGEVTRSAESSESSRARPAWLRKAVEYLHANHLDPISLTDVAAHVDIDPSHLARTFREHHGCTMTDYVRKLRVDYARQRVIGSTDSLASIAYAAGFADQAHFSRVFKQLTGVTPGALRRIARPR